MTPQEIQEGLRHALLLPDHHDHEDIAREFQLAFNNDPENIHTLLQAMAAVPAYLQEDDFKYPYIRKLIYAIGAQPEPDNLVALEELANHNDEAIAQLAAHQLEKRKRLGRWEQSNKQGLFH